MTKKNMPLERFVRRLQGAIDIIAELSDTYNNGSWLTDNYNYRALAQGFLLDSILPGRVHVSRSRHGVDATIDGSPKNIELKSVGLKGRPSLSNLKGSFDPRYAYASRDRSSKAFLIEILMISGFYNEEVIPQASMIVLDGGMSHLHDLLEQRLQSRVGRSHEMASLSAEDIIREVPPQCLVCLIGEDQVPTTDFAKLLRDLPSPERHSV